MSDVEVNSLITAEMEAAVGRELDREVSFPVSESDIRRWAIAVYYPDPPPRRFWDAEFAAATPFGGIVAPEDFNPFAWTVAERPPVVDTDGLGFFERKLGIAPPPVNHQVHGGIDVEYGEPIGPGDVITSASRLGGYRERSGRLGLMLFTTMESTWTNQRGEVVRRGRTTVIRYP